MSDRSYQVGRGRPPRQHQFKKGQSGNPAGRPKGARGLGQIIIDQLRKEVTLQENGKPIKVPTLAVVAARVALEAAHGDAKTGMALLELARRLDPTEHLDIEEVAPDETQALPPDGTALLEDYVAFRLKGTCGRG